MNPSAGFSENVFQLFKKDKKLLEDVVNVILEKSFPESIHQDIKTAIGMQEVYQASRFRRRYQEFREIVLTAYEHRCAVCGYDIRIGMVPLGVEAAHIKWHAANGPDDISNGIALCTLHHKLFDLGAFTINDRREILISEKANGSTGFHEHLIQYHKKKMIGPQNPKYYPQKEFVNWHHREVFHNPPRA